MEKERVVRKSLMTKGTGGKSAVYGLLKLLKRALSTSSIIDNIIAVATMSRSSASNADHIIRHPNYESLRTTNHRSVLYTLSDFHRLQSTMNTPIVFFFSKW